MCVNVVHCTTKTSTSYCSSLSRPLFLSHSRSSLNPFKVISNHSCSDSMVNTIVFCVTNTVYIAIQKHRRRDFFFPVHLLAVIRRYSPINQNVYWYNDYRFEFDRKRNSFSSYLPFFLSLKHTQQSLTNIIGERWKQTHIFMCSFYSLFFLCARILLKFLILVCFYEQTILLRSPIKLFYTYNNIESISIVF